MRSFITAVLLTLATLFAASPATAATITIGPGGSLATAYNSAVSGDVIEFQCGSYTDQTVPSGSKSVTVRSQTSGCAKLRSLVSDASNVTFDGLDLDDAGTAPSHSVFETGGQSNVTFKNGRIGNVSGEKGALIGGNVDPTPLNVVIDNVTFHDIVMADSSTHNEAIYLMAPGTVIQNSNFCTDGSNCGATGAILTQRGSWWGQNPWNGAKFLNNSFGRMAFDHGSILFGNHCGDVGATCRDIEIRGNSFMTGGASCSGTACSLPDNATPDLHYTNSFESCNTVDGVSATLTRMVGYGFTHETCGIDPQPTPTSTPTPTPTPTPTATPTPSPTPSVFVGRKPTTSTKTDWSGSGELDGWDFTASNVTVNRICGQTNQTSPGVTSVDLSVYRMDTKARVAYARYAGTPGTGQFCVKVTPVTLNGTVRISWLPHGNRLNFAGIAGSYVGVTGFNSTPPTTWPAGGGVNSTASFIWADNLG